jgi:hypothetical protein
VAACPSRPKKLRGDHDERRAPREGGRGRRNETSRFARSRDDIVTAAELRGFALGRDAIAHRVAVLRFGWDDVTKSASATAATLIDLVRFQPPELSRGHHD